MSSQKAVNLEKDEKVLFTVDCKIELKKGDEAKSGNFILTNKNIIFLDEKKNALFKTPLDNIVKAVKSLTSQQFIAISLKDYSMIKFLPVNIDYDSYGKLCTLLCKTIKKKKTIQDQAVKKILH